MEYIFKSKSITHQANAITSKYCRGFIYPQELSNMYAELNLIGITTGIITGDPTQKARTCEWYYNGVEVENSLYVLSMYKPENSNRIEVTIYFS